jgi:hypothetical protein
MVGGNKNENSKEKKKAPQEREKYLYDPPQQM